jgi:hypothetical protein
MVSGLEIHIVEGVPTVVAASQAGYRLYQLVHRMYTDRQPNVLFNRDGSPTQVTQWVVHQAGGDYLPIWWYGAPMLWAGDPFGFHLAPTFQVEAVQAQGLQPPYEWALASYGPIDEAHLIRYTRSAKVLAWVGNDAIAKDDIRAQAEGFRMAYSMYPQDNWGGIIPTGMLACRNYVDDYPGWGLPYGRGEGWGLDIMNAAYSIAGQEWRQETRPWFCQVADLLEDGQMDCTGILQSTPLMNVFDAQYRCRQSIEAAITENAIVGMRESVFDGDDAARTAQVDGVLRDALYAMISPLVWSEDQHGPWAMIATGSFDMTQPPFCSYFPPDGTYGYTDHYQVWNSFAYGYELTGDQRFIQKAEEMLGGDLYTVMQAGGLSNIQNGAALLALAQSLGGLSP